ncbi:hypothetical protein [Aquimarina sp. LLG6339-5]|uniref:hypothetical protein n=1 Tax=Aquimarina sp. LLG6339-5 TaxID=3160830 RepID=UPI0038646005
MKKIYILLLLLFSIASCNLKEQIQKIREINNELETEFKHDEIYCAFNFGTDEETDYFLISFYEYDLTNKTHSELETLAKEVKTFFVKRNPEYDDLDFIEIRFTKSNQENANSYVNFRFE